MKQTQPAETRGLGRPGTSFSGSVKKDFFCFFERALSRLPFRSIVLGLDSLGLIDDQHSRKRSKGGKTEVKWAREKKKKEERFFPRSILLPLRFSRERKRKAKTEKPGKRKTRRITRPIGTRLNTYYIIFRSLENPRVPARLTFFFFYLYIFTPKSERQYAVWTYLVHLCVYVCTRMCVAFTTIFLFVSLSVFFFFIYFCSHWLWFFCYSCCRFPYFIHVRSYLFLFFSFFFFSFVCLLPRVPPATS